MSYTVTTTDINTSTRIPAPTNGCATVMEQLNTSPTVSAFLTNYKIEDIATGSTGENNVLKNVENLLTVIKQQPDTTTQINTSDVQTTYLNNLKSGGTEYEKLNLVNECLLEKANVNLDRLNKEKDALEESKDRYEFIANPEMRTSYYEGWFPINRPMKEGSLFLLFASGLFLLLFSVVVFLRMGGIELNIQLPGYMESATGGFFTENKKFLGTALVLSILIVGFTYMFRDEIKKQTGYKLYE
jgi:hypothetical protein